MRVFAVSGVHRTGKTTTVEQIVNELRRRGHTVGTIKSIHRPAFSIDATGSNTARHRDAGSEIVTALSSRETAVIYGKRLSYDEILEHYDTDWVIIEGGHDTPFPRIVCARNEQDIDERLDELTFLICGQAASSIREYRGIPALDATVHAREVVDMVEKTVPEYDGRMSDSAPDNAGRNMGETVAGTPLPAHGSAPGEGPMRDEYGVQVWVDGRDITLIPFVQDFIARTILGMFSSLKGMEHQREVKIEIRRVQ